MPLTEELEQKLADDFSFMRQRPSLYEQVARGRIDDLYGAFGVESEDGWFDLIYECCKEIQKEYDNAGLVPEIRPVQIKEKYGGLRFYYGSDSDSDCRTQGKEDEYDRVWDRVGEIVDKYEKKSTEVCERCGKAGKIRPNLSWIQTLCDDCYNDTIKRHGR